MWRRFRISHGFKLQTIHVTTWCVLGKPAKDLAEKACAPQNVACILRQQLCCFFPISQRLHPSHKIHKIELSSAANNQWTELLRLFSGMGWFATNLLRCPQPWDESLESQLTNSRSSRESGNRKSYQVRFHDKISKEHAQSSTREGDVVSRGVSRAVNASYKITLAEWRSLAVFL